MNRPNKLNIYSVKGGRPSSYSRRGITAAAGCLIVAVILLSKRILQQPSTSSSSEIHESKCWLKQAINSGECQLFSHRSYYNAQTDDCRTALEQLKSIGVNHLDLDLVLTENNNNNNNNNNNGVEANGLIVAHPMEYKEQPKHTLHAVILHSMK